MLSTAEFAVEEWEETREETISQLREFETFMRQALAGDMTLIDEFGSAQLVRESMLAVILAPNSPPCTI